MLHHRYAKTVIALAVIVAVALGSFVAAGLSVKVVESSSMCVPNNTMAGPPYQDYTLDYFLWTITHPFNQTLNVGDLIIIQSVDPKTLNTNYPNSDIIVYQAPTDPTKTPIVHRIVTSYEENGTLYFQTKGDGNGDKWPAVPSSSEYDSNSGVYAGNGQGVPSNLVIGKVVMRIPYLGWITLFFRTVPWATPLVIVLIMLLIILEFVVPVIKRKPKPNSVTETTI